MPEPWRGRAGALLGRHDFTTFRAAQCQANSPLRTLDRLDVSRYGDEIVVEASARSFLHNQVRSMVGSLKLVGEGKWQPRDGADSEAARACSPVTAAACGAAWRPACGLVPSCASSTTDAVRTSVAERVSEDGPAEDDD